MGQIISSLNLRGNESIVPEINFDIENATPSSEEMEVYEELYKSLVEPNSNMLETVKNLKPASDQIRNAIATPNEDTEKEAREAVLPTVKVLHEIYKYSSELEQGIPRLLDNVLCEEGDTTKNLDRHPGLTKIFAEILDFVFEFDYEKIKNPTMQNAFSYYRRLLQTGRAESALTPTSPKEEQSDLRLAVIGDDLSNQISLFIASHTPLLKSVIDTTTTYVQSKQLVKYTSEWLASIWAACHQTLISNYKKSSNGLVDTFCLKVMVVSIILYDHIDPNGAFAKTSPIDIKGSLKIIQTANQINRQEQSSTSNLVSALKYNSKHLYDESTPKGIKNSVMAI
ncbi:hypothetical protein [Parasitella parasitica]|uniref:CYRIA/CYRIB Rac1 binding domain-containing protein n=1 Tax=Parasitella parasitica TaxID=35722 RepID=A0A0B7NQ02_9FUNG|nr:hypothetical protein [Parasitella parasitica]